MTERPLDDRDGPRDECGVFGVYAPGRDVARLSYFGLFALQHRGQESAGIATCEGGMIMTLRDLGLAPRSSTRRSCRALAGTMAIGHVRYSTTGGGAWENTQPVWRDDGREVALAHNGNLTNAVELYAELRDRGIPSAAPPTRRSSRRSCPRHRRKRSRTRSSVDAAARGAYSTVVMTKSGDLRLPRSQRSRPCRSAASATDFLVASESCAFDIVGAELLREVNPGEMVSLSERGIEPGRP